MFETTNYVHLWVLIASAVLAILVIVAAVITVRTPGMSAVVKAVWVVVLVCVPGLGLIVWGVARLVGSRAEHSTSVGSGDGS